MSNLIRIIVCVLFVGQAYATTLDFKVCDAERNANQVKVTDTQIIIRSSNGNADVVMKRISEETFRPGDLGDGEAVILSILGIRSYTDGIVFETTSAETKSVPVMIFNYGKKLKAVLLLVEGWPIPVGKSDNCK